ncbi:MAG TPA: hypothetical protein VFQ92_11190 [Blastocatellia bacterium]|nr:hypothetical protein [Blastocatellia bacterium]
MELYPGPNFNFGGRVHSNGHLFLMAGNNLYFRPRVTAVGEIVRDISRSGKSLTDGNWLGKVWVADDHRQRQRDYRSQGFGRESGSKHRSQGQERSPVADKHQQLRSDRGRQCG